jgi:hypothetical protein
MADSTVASTQAVPDRRFIETIVEQLIDTSRAKPVAKLSSSEECHHFGQDLRRAPGCAWDPGFTWVAAALSRL